MNGVPLSVRRRVAAAGAVARIDPSALTSLAGSPDVIADELIGGSATAAAGPAGLALDVPARGATVWRLRRPATPPWAFGIAAAVILAAVVGAYLISRRARSPLRSR
jgi:hypothetical protein